MAEPTRSAFAEHLHSLVENTKKAVQSIASIDSASALRVSGQGVSWEFMEASEQVEYCQTWARRLLQHELSRLPRAKLTGLQQVSNAFLQHIAHIQSFPVTDIRAPDRHRTLLNQIQESTHAFADAASEALSVLLATEPSHSASIDALKAQLESTVTNGSRLIDELKAELDGARTLIASITKASGKAAVSDAADDFQTEARRHLVASRVWLGVLASLLLTTLLCATYAVGWLQSLPWIGTLPPAIAESASPTGLIQIAIGKAVLFTVLTLAIVIAGRTYRANQHNACAYRHRVTALKTFDRFMNGSTDPTIRNTVLLQASQAAFAARPTGFEGKESDHNESSINLVAFAESLARRDAKL